MRSAPEIMNVIEAAKVGSAEGFFIYKATWNLIISPLKWSIGKTKEEIEYHIETCKDKRRNGKKILRNNWQLIIDSMKWVLEETDIDPIQSRRDLIPFA